MRITTAFKRLLRLSGASVVDVSFTGQGVIVTVRLRRRRRVCAECGQTGYRGRVGIFEVLVVDQELRRVLVSNPTEQAVTAAVRDMPTLFHSALAKAIAGETTFDEVLRVSPQE